MTPKIWKQVIKFPSIKNDSNTGNIPELLYFDSLVAKMVENRFKGITPNIECQAPGHNVQNSEM